MSGREGSPHPFAYYSSGRWLLSQLYVVGWAANGVIKIGVTANGRERYGPFLARGAELLMLNSYRPGDTVNEESRLAGVLSGHWPSAFGSKEEAAPLLGKRGAGWMECYRVPVNEWGKVLDSLREEE